MHEPSTHHILMWDKLCTLSICPEKKTPTVFCPNSNFTLKPVVEKETERCKAFQKRTFYFVSPHLEDFSWNECWKEKS